MPDSNDGTPALPVAPPTAAPTWFRLEIDSGLEHLARLRLVGRPQTEVETRDTIEGWIEQLWPQRGWDAQLDTPHLRRAFRELGNQDKYWPVPHDLILAFDGQPKTLWPTADERRVIQGIVAPRQLLLTDPDLELAEPGRSVAEAGRLLPTGGSYQLAFVSAVATALTRYHGDHMDQRERIEDVLELCRIVRERYGTPAQE